MKQAAAGRDSQRLPHDLDRSTETRRWSSAVLFVADLFHPIYGLAVELFDDRDMRHRGSCRRAVPMLFAGWAPDYITGANLLFRLSPTLRPAASGGDYQRLS